MVRNAGTAKATFPIVLALGLTACDAGPVAEAKSRIADRLKDPASAQFRDVEVCNHDDTVIQGELNAKNSFGAYTGYESFFHSGFTTVFSDEVEYAEWRNWNIRCFGPEIVAETDEMIEQAKMKAEAALDE